MTAPSDSRLFMMKECKICVQASFQYSNTHGTTHSRTKTAQTR